MGSTQLRRKKTQGKNKPIQWRFLWELSEDTASTGSVTEGFITWLQNVRYFRWKCPLDKDEYHLFPLFLEHNLRFRCPPWKAWNWWNPVKAHRGHMDNYETYSNGSKMYRTGKQALAVSEKFNLFRNLFFSGGKHRKRPTRVPWWLTKISDFLFWRRERLLCIVKDRRQETEDIKLRVALCWLFDVKRFNFVTLWLLGLIPTSTDPSEALLVKLERLSGRVLKQL